MSVVLRRVLRNFAIMLGVALPSLLLSGLLVGWLLPTALGGSSWRGVPSLDDFVGSFLFMYVFWAPVAIGVVLVHQLFLAILPRDWPARRMRLAVLGTSLVMGGLIVGYVVANGTDHPWALVITMFPPAVAYGLLARPLRTSGLHGSGQR